ncbi:hypothetical protein FHR83_006815 [Actinoplanes campanulatus]|uniref:Uncharacterized protein n=1 Tax=Actinoplanes campanulatus TaxID=113559 RepID=A0A7W5ANJ5_9ACTN|nr:hypothetical protein [Actinoplanes campanulatus]MBB3099109.1 hypothetical protein [Actinoplanes campanulatus]GGN39004.1 hypothetical protein GCM10010109_66440 [Actinoplanes campanulatus]GID40265.1 hypothetical protein Aca09nite_67710 [Actinoplanes campanulatus]
MALREHTCWSLHCDRCDTDYWDDGIPHFDSRQEALDYVKDSWLIVGDTMLCTHCADKAGCESLGHQVGDWTDNTHATGITYRHRACHCRARSEWDPPSEHVLTLIDAARVVNDADTKE